MGDNIVLPDKVNDMEEALLLFLLRLKSMYCMVLLQFALFLYTFSAESVEGRETLQNLTELRSDYQIMKEKFT